MPNPEATRERAARIAGPGATPEEVADIEAAWAAFERDLDAEAEAWVDEVERLMRAREPLKEAEFDPAEHPREPRGSPEGGEFAPKGTATPAPGEPSAPAAPLRKFEDLKAAKAWMKAAHPRTIFSPDEADVAAMQPTLEAFDGLARSFPRIARMVRRIQVGGELPGVDPKETASQTAYALTANYGVQGDKWAIWLSPRYRDAGALRAQLAKDERSGWHPVGTIEAVLAHEFGHLVDRMYLNLKSERFAGRAPKVRREIEGKLKELRTVSRYASTDDREAFAESFSAYFEWKAGRAKPPAAPARWLGERLERAGVYKGGAKP